MAIPFSCMTNRPPEIFVMKIKTTTFKITLHEHSFVSFCIETRLINDFGTQHFSSLLMGLFGYLLDQQ